MEGSTRLIVAGPIALALKIIVVIKALLKLVLNPGLVTPPVNDISPVVLLKNSSVQVVINESVLSNLTTSTRFLGKVMVAFQRLDSEISERVKTLTANSWPGGIEIAAGFCKVNEVSGVVDSGDGEAVVPNVTVAGVKSVATEAV